MKEYYNSKTYWAVIYSKIVQSRFNNNPIFLSIIYNFPKLLVQHSCSFPKHRWKSICCKACKNIYNKASCHSIRTSVLTIMQCKSRNNIIAINYKQKMSFWFKVKKSITNQISKHSQIKSINQPNHFILICFKYLSHQIFESPLIWTELWQLYHLNA